MLRAVSHFHLSYFSFSGFLLSAIGLGTQGTGCGSTGMYQIKLISLNMGSSGLYGTIKQHPERVNCTGSDMLHTSIVDIHDPVSAETEGYLRRVVGVKWEVA
jgi:hypothetical protein